MWGATVTVLFSGTVSFNIDPTQASTDSEIWAALDKVHLGEKVRSLEGGLEATVSEYGDMFSTGQRQLVCVRIRISPVSIAWFDWLCCMGIS